MPLRTLRARIGLSKSLRRPGPLEVLAVCPACSFSQAICRAPPRDQSRNQPFSRRISHRQQSNLASATASESSARKHVSNSRKELRDSLIELQKQAGTFVNISRLQLAMRGLEQTPGDETIRIAILGLADGGSSLKTAKELLRLMVADPLKTEEKWERILTADHNIGKPLLLKVGYNVSEEGGQTSGLLQELNVSTATLKGHKLELLVMDLDPPLQDSGGASFSAAVLVPTVEIPISSTGRYASITTPVHKSLLVANGFLGAAKALSLPADIDREVIGVTVNLQTKPDTAVPLTVVDIGTGKEALFSFRQSVTNATHYEQGWFASGVPEVLEWLKGGVHSTTGAMKAPIRKLIESLLKDTQSAIQTEKARQLRAVQSSRVSSAELISLRLGLTEWAERAHTELRDELEIAFNGRRWRKLGWWKLFWRVDDVLAISTDILNQRFLTEAEKEIVFLAGRIEESGMIKQKVAAGASPTSWAYKPVPEPVAPEARLGDGPAPPRIRDMLTIREDEVPASITPQPWPLHIPVARMYLARGTIPALQALAQRLVLQTLTTSSFASIFGGLIYVSSLSTTLYEAGAVAALGIVYSLKRMQGKWETARKFWEGEVREEGRRAVRGVESSVQDVLKETTTKLEGEGELQSANEALKQAEVALQAVK